MPQFWPRTLSLLLCLPLVAIVDLPLGGSVCVKLRIQV